MAKVEGVDLVYSNPAETRVDKFDLYTADQVSKAMGQEIPTVKVPRGLRSILTTVVFPKKENWTPARVSYHARRFKERGYSGEIFETTQSYRYTMDILPEVTERIKFFRYKPRTIKKGKDVGKKFTLLFGIIPRAKVPAKVPVSKKVGQKLEPIRPANFRTPEAQYKTIRKGLIAKMRTKKITHITPKVAKKYKLYPEAKKYKIRVEQEIPEKVINELKGMEGQVAGKVSKKERVKRMWVGKIKAGKVKSLKKSFAEKYDLTALAKKHGIKVGSQVGQQVSEPSYPFWKTKEEAIKDVKDFYTSSTIKGVRFYIVKIRTNPNVWLQAKKGGVFWTYAAGKDAEEAFDKIANYPEMLQRKTKIISSLYEVSRFGQVKQVGQEIITRRERKITKEVADFIKAQARKQIKPNVIKGLVKQKFNVVVSTSTIYKVAKSLYKTSVVEHKVEKEVSKMSKQKISDVLGGGLEDAVIAEIMANPGLTGIFKRCPSVGRFATKLAQAGLTARQVTNRINDAITKAGKVGNISVNRLRNWGKSIGKAHLFSRYTGTEAEKKAKWNRAKAVGFPRIRGKGGVSLGKKGAAGLASMRAEIVRAGKEAAEVAIAKYKGRYPKEAIAARRAMAKAVAGQVMVEENPIGLDLRGTGKDILAKLIGVFAGVNVTGLVKKGVDALIVKEEVEGWKPKASQIGSGLIGYFIGDVLDRMIKPTGAYAGMVREIFESFRTGAVVYMAQAIPMPEKLKAITIESGVESYIDSLAERALGAQVGAELILIPTDTAEAVNQEVLPDGTTLIRIADTEEPVSAQMEEIQEPVEAQLEEIE